MPGPRVGPIGCYTPDCYLIGLALKLRRQKATPMEVLNGGKMMGLLHTLQITRDKSCSAKESELNHFGSQCTAARQASESETKTRHGGWQHAVAMVLFPANVVFGSFWIIAMKAVYSILV